MVGLGYRSIAIRLIRIARLTRIFPSGNEHEVGQGIKDSGVPREEIFLTSKLWNTHQPNVKEGLEKSLDALGTDYLDLYVRHKLVSISDDRSFPVHEWKNNSLTHQ
jgi:diketogulonate reductase-like aldo/keto reductase